MSIFRLIAIALPMTVLVACGGGGGGGSIAMTGTPTTMMPPPVTAPTITPPASSNPQTLPPYLITDLVAARTAAGGSPPANMSYSDIINEFRTRATNADTLRFADVQISGALGSRQGMISPSCMGTSCTVSIPDIGDTTFSLAEIYDPSIINDESLEGYDAQVQAVMVDEGVTLVQGRSAARGDGGTPFTFQTYAGWIDGSVFGFGLLSVTEGSNTTSRLTSYSFGDASDSNPIAIGSETSAMWTGAVVLYRRNESEIVEGSVTVDIDDLSSPDVDVAIDLGFISSRYDNMPLMRGTFVEENGQVRGSFYGDNHEEVGGLISTTNDYGAFGATRQIQ